MGASFLEPMLAGGALRRTDLHLPRRQWGNSAALKVHMPSCVVLVINDNPCGLMFLLNEGTIHREILKTMCWIQGWIQ
jgi:hypothetical protein